MKPTLVIAFLLLLAVAPSHGFEPRTADANLHSVHFIDKDEGWAVGDEGVIWHTVDAGKNWELQASTTRASLRSVHFLNPLVGWAVGREELPFGGSAGVVLYTRDGGAKWERQDGLANALPGLNAIRFVDPLNPYLAYLLADSNDQFPSGLFKTTDGGKSWAAMRGPRAPAWLAAEFLHGETGTLVGPWSHLARLADGQIEFADIEALAGRSLRGVCRLKDRLLVVGDGGVVLSSTSSGKSWGFANLPLSHDVRACLDFYAVAHKGASVWIVGRPGSVLLRSTNHGETWETYATGQSLPLASVHFHSETNGWAVGAAGTILATTDGGKTWSVQRQGGKRAAALLAHGRTHHLPVDTLAHLGVEEGCLVTALRFQSADPASAAPRQALAGVRHEAATRRAGGLVGESLWHFSLPLHLEAGDREQVLAYWNERFAGKAADEILRQLVLALRIWRPDVVVAPQGDATLSGPAAAILAEALEEAVKRAQDPLAFPEHIKELGLPAWKVTRLFVECDKTKRQVEQDNLQPRDRLEGNAREFAAGPLSLLADQASFVPAQRYFRLLGDSASPPASLLAGLPIAEGDARAKVTREEVDPEYRKLLAARSNLITLAEKLDEPAKVLGVLEPVLKKLPDTQAAPAAHSVAAEYARRGQWHLAREVYVLMVDRYPSHPLTVDALRWLIRHSSSSEVKRRYELDQFVAVQKVGFQASADPIKALQQGGVQSANAVQANQDLRHAYLSERPELRDWHKASLELSKHLSKMGPLFAFDPSMQFCVQASRRKVGEFEAASNFYEKFAEFVPRGPWHEAAKSELWLNNRSRPAGRCLAVCRLAPARPYLDGKFDDPCWEGIKPMVLDNAAGKTRDAHATQAMLAYDQEFLYLAVKCAHPAGQTVEPRKVRKRDENLDGHDRISLLLDLDRDYSTYFRFEVDQRGCVREDCWGDVNWNPKWFVAVHHSETAWQVEAAIPLHELTRDAVPLGSAWACNIVRTLPGRGVQSWSLPADVEPRPEGMCLLLFHQDAARPAMPQAR